MKKSLPIDLTKRDLLDVFKRQERPLSLDDLKGMVDSWKSRKREIKDLLRELTREGSLVRLKNNRFGIPDEMNLEVGTLWCTRSGNGFVVPDKGGEKDVFVPSRFIKGALHGDKVVVRVEHSRRGKREGQIVKVTERKTRNVTGFLEERKGLLFLVPDDERISARFIVEPGKAASEWEQGDLAAAKVTRFPETGDPECKLLKVFKGLDDVKKISQFIVYKHGLSHRFPRNAEVEAKADRASA